MTYRGGVLSSKIIIFFNLKSAKKGNYEGNRMMIIIKLINYHEQKKK